MKRLLKPFGVALVALGLVVGGYFFYKGMTYQFETITPGKVYKSGAMPPDRLIETVQQYGIKTVIDLRHQGLRDALHPEEPTDIAKERDALAALEGVRHVHIPSRQVPTRESLEAFLKTLDDPNVYPVLIHCYHGTGRAMIYSSLYRAEYEGYSGEEARDATHWIIYGSNFADGTGKGDFLRRYQSRASGRFEENFAR